MLLQRTRGLLETEEESRPAQRRIDKRDGQAYTYEEFRAYYGRCGYSKKEIKAYWDEAGERQKHYGNPSSEEDRIACDSKFMQQHSEPKENPEQHCEGSEGDFSQIAQRHADLLEEYLDQEEQLHQTRLRLQAAAEALAEADSERAGG